MHFTLQPSQLHFLPNGHKSCKLQQNGLGLSRHVLRIDLCESVLDLGPEGWRSETGRVPMETQSEAAWICFPLMCSVNVDRNIFSLTPLKRNEHFY